MSTIPATKLIRWFRSRPVAFLTLMIVIGYAVGISLSLSSPYLLWLSWDRALTSPPTTVQIVAYNGSALLIKASDTFLYACDLRQATCAQTTEPLKDEQNSYFFDCPAVAPETPILVGNIVSTFSRRFCGVDSYADVHIIAFEDGNVWIGRRFYSVYEEGSNSLIRLYMMGCLGSLVAACLSIVVMLAVWMTTSR